jgi:hypothetical protein
MLCLATNAAGQAVPPGTAAPPGTTGTVGQPTGPPYEIRPYIFATEQYTSNVFLTNTNQKSDWITTLGPGIRLAVNNPSFGADLTGNFGYNWYANQTKEDYWSIDGTLGLRYNPTPQLTFRIREYILRSQNTVEPNYAQGGQPAQPGVMVGTNRSDTPYLRNVVETSVDWQFSRQGSVGILYRNNILRNDDNIAYEDSTENYVRPSFSYWISQRSNIVLDYGFTKGEYTREGALPVSPDFVSHTPHGRYTYRFDARMSVFADYIYIYQDYDEPGIDYQVNNPSVGITYAFNPTLIGTAQVGYFWQNPERFNGESGVSSNLSITQREQQTTYTLAIYSGYQQNQFGFENTGFNTIFGGSAVILHNVTQRFNVGFIGTALNTDYALSNQNDWLYTADATASYRFLRWLTLNGRVGYQQNDSNITTASYDEWHVFLTLTATFDNLLY